MGYSTWGHKESDTTEQLTLVQGFLHAAPKGCLESQQKEQLNLSPHCGLKDL